MRVCLIIPPSGFLLDERVFPSLGVLKVAAALERKGIPVEVLDLSGRTWPVEKLPAADVYGITATTPQMPSAGRIALDLITMAPEAKRILGGPHVTLLNASAKYGVERAQRALRELGAMFHALVAGDGERAIFAALEGQGLIDADDPKSPLFLQAPELDAQPLPARHLIDLDSYHYEIEGVRTQSMIAQLGCPFGCAFCGGRRSPFLRRVRMRSQESVLAEMEHLYRTYGTRGFMFLDDELNVNRGFMDLLSGIVALQDKLGESFRLRGLLKSELLTAGQANLMRRAGFRQVLVGFESGSPRMLLNMEKRATLDDNTRCVDLLQGAGIKVKALMSLGHAGETVETVYDTARWLLTVGPDDFDVTIITVYPGTPYYDDAKDAGTHWTYTAKNGDRLHFRETDHLRDENFYKGVPGSYYSFVWTDEVSSDDLVRLRDWTEAEVRSGLDLPYPSAPAAVQYEHSMGLR